MKVKRWMGVGGLIGSIFACFWVLSGCVGLPKGVTPVEGFVLDRYMGKWYEVARLDHSFERGMTQVSAEYEKMADGRVRVVNRGYLESRNEWKQVEGVAKFVGRDDLGHLKVSFFGPFYGSYVIVELDHEGYEYALVSGPNRSYLWILSRKPELDERVRQRLIEKAKGLGYETERLLRVDQKVRG